MSRKILLVMLGLATFTSNACAKDAPANLSDPYKAAQHAWMCRGFVNDGPMTPTDPWTIQPYSSQPSDDYMIWSETLAKLATWSAFYGHSLSTIDQEHRYRAIAAVNEPDLLADCKNQIGTLPAQVQEAVANIYTKNWRAVRESMLAHPNATPASTPEKSLQEADWCVAAFEYGMEALKADPKGYFTVDVNAAGGPERLEKFKRAFTQQLEGWKARAQELAAQPETKTVRRNRKLLIQEVLVFFNHSGLNPVEAHTVTGYFLQQETNDCAVKKKAIDEK